MTDGLVLIAWKLNKRFCIRAQQMNIDKQIAIEVMGIEQCNCKLNSRGWFSGIDVLGNHTDCHKQLIPKKYSTNIADAWLVVERMRELEKFIVIEMLHDDVYVEFQGAGACNGAREETAPMAICNAALEAKENKE